MSNRLFENGHLLWIVVPYLWIIVGTSLGENIDPAGDGSQYAYAENAGWINCEPGGDAGTGIHVDDAALTGWMWAENFGWISLSCGNTSSCAAVTYGVENDGEGSLFGYAWSENAGWISFSCANTSSCGWVDYGVSIDPFDGVFSGRAWGENIGWITFASDGAIPFGVRTSWVCTPPTVVPGLSLDRDGTATWLSWTTDPAAPYCDVVHGELQTLRATAGSFSAATVGCAAEDEAGGAVSFDADPLPGDGTWFLVRAAHCGGGTFDTASPVQEGPRDAGIVASPGTCS